VFRSMSQKQINEALYDWALWARSDQIAPTCSWHVWLIMTGRGWGKTRTGAEWIKIQAAKPGTRIALVGRTPADARDVMIEGESGILSVSPDWFMPVYEPSKRRLSWPNGSMATVYSSESPKSLRGPQHEKAWGDELAAWKNSESYDNLMLGLRLGNNPQAVFTTTPKPINTVKEIVKSSKDRDGGIQITVGKTYDNIVNLAPVFLKTVIKKYEGTTLGRQELDGVLLEDLPGALWKRSVIEDNRVSVAPQSSRIVVAIDPNVTASDDADEAGIVVASLGDNGQAYVLRDGSGKFSPNEWAKRGVAFYAEYKADRIIAEVNNGGDLVEITIRTFDENVSYKSVHASRGKRARAEPVAALYEQGKVHHVGGDFEDLEDEMCTYMEGESIGSPNRMDALVWALTELMLGGSEPRIRSL